MKPSFILHYFFAVDSIHRVRKTTESNNLCELPLNVTAIPSILNVVHLRPREITLERPCAFSFASEYGTETAAVCIKDEGGK